jgi:hypothetical protein
MPKEILEIWLKKKSILERLVEGKGIKEDFTTYGSLDEGYPLGNLGFNSFAGRILTKSGKRYFYWVDWDKEKNDAVIDPFREDLSNDWVGSEEYRDAQELLGIK